MKERFTTGIITACILLSSCSPSFKIMKDYKTTGNNLLPELFAKQPGWFDSILVQKKALGIQIIYTQINRDKKGKPQFRDYFFNLEPERYFYPASTVKLPVAALALQKLNELNITGLDRNTTMFTGVDGEGQTPVSYDSTADGGRPTIAHYIKKILLVSDNDAFNRLYEFLGQEYINNSLHRMGYADAQIIHRLAVSLTEQQNRHTNPIQFVDDSGKKIYEKPAEISRLPYAPNNTLLGRGFIRADTLVNAPFDFSQKNRIGLESLHSVLKSILFPESVSSEKQFKLTQEDYDFLWKYMSMKPSESDFPAYRATEYWDNYVKMVYYGREKSNPDSSIRIFNKSGWSYGFLTDVAYVTDLDRNIEFMVSANIYCNSDSIFNDDAYDYKEIGYPFMQQLGKALYEYELQRIKNKPAGVSKFRIHYTQPR